MFTADERKTLMRLMVAKGNVCDWGPVAHLENLLGLTYLQAKDILYPMSEKLAKVKDRAQAIGQFIEWLGEKGIHLAEYHRHSVTCCESEDDFHNDNFKCGFRDDTLYQYQFVIQILLADYFGIDQDKLEAEKREMLENLRKQQT